MNMTFITSLIFGIFSSFVLKFLVKFLYRRWKMSRVKIPYPKFKPLWIEIFYGNYLLVTSTSAKRFKVLCDLMSQRSKPFKMWFGINIGIVVNTPEMIQKVLYSPSCLEKWKLFYQYMERKVGLVAGSVRGNWQENRKFYNHFFGLNYLENYCKVFEKHSKILCHELESELNKGEFDISKKFRQFSFKIISETLLGEDNYNQADEVLDAYDKYIKAFGEKTRIPYIYPQTIYKFTKIYKDDVKARKILRDYFVKTIEKRKKLNLMENNNFHEEFLMIDGILKNSDKLNRKDIFMHLDAFLHTLEPTAMSFSHTILLLAMNPHVQEKLFDELKDSSIDEISLNQNSINDLKYLDLVCKESLRFMPPIPIISRQTLEDFEIEDGVILPEETSMLINIYTLQRNKKYWSENADQFIPERFLPENLAKIYPNSYIPFSAGRRMCIAHKYSKFAIKIFIARLVKKFKFTTSLKEIKPRSVLMLNLCTEHSVQIELRH